MSEHPDCSNMTQGKAGFEDLQNHVAPCAVFTLAYPMTEIYRELEGAAGHVEPLLTSEK